jgi:hypothetical protein
LKQLCGVVLDNGFERGRSIPKGKSRLEGWPHLGAKAGANIGRVLPQAAHAHISSHSHASSRWPYSYPLSEDGSKVEGVGTLELLKLLESGTPPSFSSSSVNHFAANFGANDGKTSDPVAALYHAGWGGLAVELESIHCGKLERNLGGTNASLKCPLGVNPANVQALLEEAQAPLEMGYLKVDIDSYDCDVLAAILAAGYRPKVVVLLNQNVKKYTRVLLVLATW